MEFFGNYKSDVNETCIAYVPPQQLLFGEKMGMAINGVGVGDASKNKPKKGLEINKLSTLASLKNSLKNAIKVVFFLISSLTI